MTAHDTATDDEGRLSRLLMDAQAACPPSYTETWVRCIQPVLDARTQRLDAVLTENARLKAIAVHLHWMARRYADGRQSYATSLHNENTRELLAMGVPLNATGDGTLWARDMAGRCYDGLTDEEAVQGREPDWRHDDKERRIEEQAKLIAKQHEALIAAKQLNDVAVAQFDWGKSCLTAEAIRLLNEVPIVLRNALAAHDALTRRENG